VSSFIEPDLFDNNVPFDNTTPIHLINLRWKLGLGLGLELKVALFITFHGVQRKRAPYFSRITEGNIVVKEHIHSVNNKIKLYILGVSMNKLGNWLIEEHKHGEA